MLPRKFGKPIRMDPHPAEANRSMDLIKAMDGKAPIGPHVSGIHTTVGLISVARFYARANRVRRGIRRENFANAVRTVDTVLANKVLRPPGKV